MFRRRGDGGTVIARAGDGGRPEAKADAYLEFLHETGIREYRQTPGNRGVYVLVRGEAGRAEFLVLSLWDSYEAIRRFAGPDVEKAVFYPRDREYFLEMDPTASHYDVAVSP